MSAYAWTENAFCRPKPWLGGVCAKLAESAGAPVWLPRAVMVGLLLTHGLLALLIYAGLAVFWRSPAGRPAAPPAPPPTYAADPRTRFSNLEERLAAMEAAAMSEEARLRREFRNLGA